MRDAGIPWWRRDGAALLATLAAAAALRFHDLTALPPAHYRDVALTALDAMRAAAGHPLLHYTYDEGLYANLMGLGFLLFRVSDLMVRAPGALFGVLTCFGVYRLGRAFERPRAGLYGAGLLAVSFWHVLLSRSGFRAILLPLLLVFSLALLVEGLRLGRKARLAAAGILFGLGVHVYPSVRFAPLFVAVFLMAELGLRGAAWRRAARNLLLFAGTAFLVALPMLFDYARHPEHFTYPHRIVSVFSPKLDPAEIPARLRQSAVATLLMFHVRGDENWRHNISGSPMLDPLTGLLFLAGIVICARAPTRPLGALLLSWLGAMLLPNLLSVEGVPHGLRSSGALPAIMLLGGIGLETSRDFLARFAGARVSRVTLILFLFLVGSWTWHRYFDVWGKDPRVAEAHDGAYRAAARALLAAPPGTERILIANGKGFPAYGHPAEVEPYLFEMRDSPPVIVGPKDGALLLLGGRTAYVALVQQDEAVLARIRELNPDAPLSKVDAPGVSPESPVYRVN